ncbi:MAG: hypothetical protein WKF89_07840 [Chitinophagaceae bacterium]
MDKCFSSGANRTCYGMFATSYFDIYLTKFNDRNRMPVFILVPYDAVMASILTPENVTGVNDYSIVS